jgi:hypothetical protein
MNRIAQLLFDDGLSGPMSGRMGRLAMATNGTMPFRQGSMHFSSGTRHR